MPIKELKLCPFRPYTECRPAILKGKSDVTVTGFMPCLKEDCSAFFILKTGYGVQIETCKRLK